MVGPESTKPVFLPALGVSAHPLRLLDYLIRESTQAVVLGGSGILVNVPDPARFAFHKLWISGKRPVSEQTKATKDLRQASDLLEALVSDRPGDLPAAWEELTRSPSVGKTVRLAISRLSSRLQEGLVRQGVS